MQIGAYTSKEMEYYVKVNTGLTVDFFRKQKNLTKFGRGVVSQTPTTVSFAGNEIYLDTNTIDTISSTSVADTQAIIVEGHTITDGLFTFVVQQATLNGQNKVVLTTPLARASRLYNANAVDFAGNIYVYVDTPIVAGLPTDLTKTYLTAEGINNQSLKAATTISNNDIFFITEMQVGVNKAQAANVDFALQIRELGKVFRTRQTADGDNDAGSIHMEFAHPIICMPNSDVRIQANSSANTTTVDAFFSGIIASVVY